MTSQTRQQFTEWYKIHGTLSAVFLQVKLKISFKEAIRLIEKFQNEQ
jgi:hypothetical protein